MASGIKSNLVCHAEFTIMETKDQSTGWIKWSGREKGLWTRKERCVCWTISKLLVYVCLLAFHSLDFSMIFCYLASVSYWGKIIQQKCSFYRQNLNRQLLHVLWCEFFFELENIEVMKASNLRLSHLSKFNSLRQHLILKSYFTSNFL